MAKIFLDTVLRKVKKKDDPSYFQENVLNNKQDAENYKWMNKGDGSQ